MLARTFSLRPGILRHRDFFRKKFRKIFRKNYRPVFFRIFLPGKNAQQIDPSRGALRGGGVAQKKERLKKGKTDPVFRW
jgi:hypothetical protein